MRERPWYPRGTRSYTKRAPLGAVVGSSCHVVSCGMGLGRVELPTSRLSDTNTAGKNSQNSQVHVAKSLSFLTPPQAGTAPRVHLNRIKWYPWYLAQVERGLPSQRIR